MDPDDKTPEESNPEFDAIVQNLAQQQMIEGAKALGEAASAQYRIMRRNGLPRKLCDALTSGWVQFVLNSGMIENVRAANEAALKAAREEEDDE